jgi:acetylornithine/N-succinyldiaminopimelate aminotransferase
MWGVDLTMDATPVVDAAREQGLLVNRTNRTVVRLLPPLTISTDDLDAAVEILDAVLTDVCHESPA